MKTQYLIPEELVKADFSTVSREYEDHMLLKNYSSATVKTYMCNFRKYHEWCGQNKVEQVYNQDSVKAYLVYRVRQGAKWQTMNNIYSAMRKLFKEVLYCLFSPH